jgi:hypothetical protein
MLVYLTLPVLVLLLGLPGFGILSGPRADLSHVLAVADPLPPAWNSPSHPAIENQFVGGALPPVNVAILTGKPEGRGKRASCGGESSKQTQSIRDLEYVKGVYFFLDDPHSGAYDIPDSGIRIYLDDANSSNNVNTIRGRALIDPLGPDSVASDSSNGPFSVRGTFVQLEPGPDRDYEILRDIYGPNCKVIRLRRPMNHLLQQCLAVSYARRPLDPDGQGAGSYVAVGGKDTLDTDGQMTRVLKLLWAPPGLMKSATSDFFDPALTLSISRDLELKNFYQLGGSPIDPATFRLTIRRGVSEPPETDLTTPSGPIPYVEALGLDNFDETSGTPARGHDGEVDGTAATTTTRPFVDFEKGTLFFYDLRPFAPRIGPGGKPFELLISSVLNRRASLADVPDGPNPNTYDKCIVQLDFDTVYWMNVEVVGVDSEPGPGTLALAPARPNPFDRVTALDYDLPRAAHVRVRVFDVTGRVVITLLDGPRPAGPGRLAWGGTDRTGRRVAAGIYFAALEVNGTVLTRRIAKLE